MTPADEPGGREKLVGGRLCLDFANTVEGRVPSESGFRILSDNLRDFRDLVWWSRRAGSISGEEFHLLTEAGARHASGARKVFQRAMELREAIFRICCSAMGGDRPLPADLQVLNQEIRIAKSHETLTALDKDFAWRWGTKETSLDRLLWSVAVSAAELLTTDDLSRLRKCGGEDCGWLFYDTSRNGRRHWCDMRDCGNVAKVRRFRSRQRSN